MNWSRVAILVVIGVALYAPVGTTEELSSNLLILEVGNSAFGVLEPQGWRGQLSGNNIVFCRSMESLDIASTLITLQVERKPDRKTSDNFEIMIEEYRKRFPAIVSTDLDVSHFEYRSVGKLFQMPLKFHEYVVYVNPRKRGPLLLSVAMNTRDRPATEDELMAFTSVVRSLVLLSGNRRWNAPL